jgi:hypothetical protein
MTIAERTGHDSALDANTDTGGSAVDGNIIDRRGFESGEFNFRTGLTPSAPTSFSTVVKIEHGDASDLSDAADVTGATVTIVAVSTSGKIAVDLRPLKAYVRLTQTTTFVGGSTPTLQNSASYVLGEAKDRPAT